jgi:hypothetical protein
MSSVVNDPTESALKELIDSAVLMPGSHTSLVRTRDRLNRYIETTNSDYISTLFFPELSPPARLPTKFPTSSSIFTQKDHFYCDSDMLGRLALVILPKHIGSSEIDNMNWGTNTTSQGYVFSFTTNYQDENWGIPQLLLADNIPNYYTNVRLIGCSVRIQYIGALLNVSGMGACCLNYGFMPGHESVNTVEDSDYVQHVGTAAGLRMIWAPKDQNDFNYMNLTTQQQQYGDSTQAFMIYYSNLPAGAQKLRVDIVRQFEGIPNELIYNYVALARQPHSEATIDAAATFHEKCPFLFTLPLADVQKTWVLFKNFFGIWDRFLNNFEYTQSGLYSKISGKNISAESNPLDIVSKELDLI